LCSYPTLKKLIFLFAPDRPEQFNPSVSFHLDFIKSHFTDLQYAGDLLRFGIEVPGKNDGVLQPAGRPPNWGLFIKPGKI